MLHLVGTIKNDRGLKYFKISVCVCVSLCVCVCVCVEWREDSSKKAEDGKS